MIPSEYYENGSARTSSAPVHRKMKTKRKYVKTMGSVKRRIPIVASKMKKAAEKRIKTRKTDQASHKKEQYKHRAQNRDVSQR